MVYYTLAEYWIVTVKFLIIILLAGLIGYEREKIHRPAGLRTHIIVGIGALVISLISVKSFPDDPARVMAGIVTGIGFLGAGTIFREKDFVKGLTTAASVWSTAGIGMALALDNYFVAIIGGITIYLILQTKHLKMFRSLFGHGNIETVVEEYKKEQSKKNQYRKKIEKEIKTKK